MWRLSAPGGRRGVFCRSEPGRSDASPACPSMRTTGRPSSSSPPLRALCGPPARSTRRRCRLHSLVEEVALVLTRFCSADRLCRARRYKVSLSAQGSSVCLGTPWLAPQPVGACTGQGPLLHRLPAPVSPGSHTVLVLCAHLPEHVVDVDAASQLRQLLPQCVGALGGRGVGFTSRAQPRRLSC